MLALVAEATAHCAIRFHASEWKGDLMNKYIIERNVPGAGKLSPQELCTISNRSVEVLRELGPEVQWIESFVTADKLYCVYLSKSADLIREHARRGGFPVDIVNQVETIIDPTTAQAR
jgi:hypothetical protein